MDYPIYDAIEAGFNKIIFAIRIDIENIYLVTDAFHIDFSNKIS